MTVLNIATILNNLRQKNLDNLRNELEQMINQNEPGQMAYRLGCMVLTRPILLHSDDSREMIESTLARLRLYALDRNSGNTNITIKIIKLISGQRVEYGESVKTELYMCEWADSVIKSYMASIVRSHSRHV
jgi:hypothetical protein